MRPTGHGVVCNHSDQLGPAIQSSESRIRSSGSRVSTVELEISRITNVLGQNEL